jgi:hypothetical protein
MSSPHPNGGTSMNDDGVDMKKILLVGGASLFTFIVSALIAYLILRSDAKQVDAQGRPARPTEIGRDEIGIVDQLDFSVDNRLAEWKAAKRKRLETYGWVDREKRLVHIPIEKAIEQVISQSGAGP